MAVPPSQQCEPVADNPRPVSFQLTLPPVMNRLSKAMHEAQNP